MPFPKAMTRVNRRFVNPLMRHLAVRLPMMGVVHHAGRTSGQAYQTPVLIFRSGNRVVIALTYGRDVDWVRNVSAAGACTIRSRGRDLALVAPVVRRDDTGGVRLPWPVRQVMRRANVRDYLHLRLMTGNRP